MISRVGVHEAEQGWQNRCWSATCPDKISLPTPHSGGSLLRLAITKKWSRKQQIVHTEQNISSNATLKGRHQAFKMKEASKFTLILAMTNQCDRLKLCEISSSNVSGGRLACHGGQGHNQSTEQQTTITRWEWNIDARVNKTLNFISQC